MKKNTLGRTWGLARWALIAVGIGLAGCETLFLEAKWDDFEARKGCSTCTMAAVRTASMNTGSDCPDVVEDAGMPPSCIDDGGGLLLCPEVSCCDSPAVPKGMDGCGMNVCGFHLDAYEVTVGRFNAFLEAPNGYDAAAAAGTGGLLPKDKLIGELAACKSTLSSTTQNNQLAINCVTWAEANAFCKWDGGRLPTLGDYRRAALGTSNANDYPWGDELPDPSRATFGSKMNDPNPVGIKHDGGTDFGQYDLAGNVAEWTANECDATAEAVATFGGSFNSDAGQLQIDNSVVMQQSSTRSPAIGFRCARP